MSEQLQFKVTNQIIERTDSFKVVSNSRNYLYAKFTFASDEWSGHAKTAIFKCGFTDVSYEAILENDACLVPHEALAHDNKCMFVSVFAGDLVTANAVKIPIIPSGYTEDVQESLEPTPSVYEKITNDLEDIKELIKDVSEGAEANIIDSISVNGTNVEPDENKNVELSIPTHTSELENDSDFPVDENYVHTDNNYTNDEKTKLENIESGAQANVNADWNASSGDAEILHKPTTLEGYGVQSVPVSLLEGVIDISNLPKGALERMVVVADDTARKALTRESVQNGDVVKVESTGVMYYVVDDTKLNLDDGYSVFTAGAASSVPWSGVTGKPSTVSGYGLTDAYTKTEIDSTVNGINTAIDGKVDKVTGKGLSKNDFTDELKTKLDGIEDGAQANVNADWNALSGDAKILHKPTTINGYGIEDAYTKTEINAAISENVETGNTASKLYDIGDYLIWNGKPYRVIARMSQGSTLTVGTNIEYAPLADEIKDIQSHLEFDDEPTEDSNNPVTSDGIYNAIQDIPFVHGEGDNSAMMHGASNARGANSIAEGASTVATGNASHAEGSETTASATGSHSEGISTSATGSGSHAEGGGSTMASGSYSHAEGYGTTASGDYSHTEGGYSRAQKSYSHAEGANTIADGNYGHAEGYNTKVYGTASHAEGQQTTVSASHAHAEGYSNTVSGQYGHAEGNANAVSGISAHGEGSSVEASGSSSHAEGNHTIANHHAQHVFGEYNVADPSQVSSTMRGTYAEIVGNGTQSARSNARTLDWSGNEVLSGGLKAGTYLGIGNSSFGESDIDDFLASVPEEMTYAEYSQLSAEEKMDGKVRYITDVNNIPSAEGIGY